MKNETVKKALELQELIRVTKNAVEELKRLRDTQEKKKNTKEKNWYDGLYFLTIAEQSDGSGVRVDLNRYFGNVEILVTLIKIVEKQLLTFETEFEKL